LKLRADELGVERDGHLNKLLLGISPPLSASVDPIDEDAEESQELPSTLPVISCEQPLWYSALVCANWVRLLNSIMVKALGFFCLFVLERYTVYSNNNVMCTIDAI
jgi:hypothetical protein